MAAQRLAEYSAHLTQTPFEILMLVQGYQDRIELRRVKPAGALEHTFVFADKTEPKQGDYYTVRIVQEDDQLAWSSPIWVGGYPVRRD